MHFSSRHAQALVMVFALALPFKAGGCGGRTACFTVTSANLGSDGSCPGIDVASMRLVNAPCSGMVGSVDGPGALDANLCCYPVTYIDSSVGVPCNLGPGTTTGFGSSTGFFGGPGGGTTTTGGFGGFGGGPANCVRCNDALNGAPFNLVCTPQILANLRACACASKCTSACDPTLCATNAPDDGCLSCLDVQCGAELTACQQN